MAFLIGVMLFMILVVGLDFSVLLIGGIPFKSGAEFDRIHIGRRAYTVPRFVMGVSTTALGLCWLVVWGYFLIRGWDSFTFQFNFLIYHVLLQLFVSVLLLLSGIAIFRKWPRRIGLFLTTMGVLLVSVVMALRVYGPTGHGSPFFMYVFGVWSLAIAALLGAAAFLFEKLIYDIDERLPGKGP